jgi:rod shape-determining protein MreC
VILLTDLNSRIPVAVEPGNIQAIMSGDNTGAPTLETLGQGVQLKEGDQIVTSGDGGLLPSGLQIGTVAADGYIFRAVLLSDAGTSDDVRILNLKSPPEQPPAPSPNDLPVSAAGLAPLAPPAAAPTAANGASTAGQTSSPVKLLHPLTPAPPQATAPADPDDR